MGLRMGVLVCEFGFRHLLLLLCEFYCVCARRTYVCTCICLLHFILMGLLFRRHVRPCNLHMATVPVLRTTKLHENVASPVLLPNPY
jgi:hypothetical protein